MPKLTSSPEDMYQRVTIYKHDLVGLTNCCIPLAVYWIEFNPDTGRLINHDIPDPDAAAAVLELAIAYYRRQGCQQWRAEKADLAAGDAARWQNGYTLYVPAAASQRALVRRVKALYGWTGRRCRVVRENETTIMLYRCGAAVRLEQFG